MAIGVLCGTLAVLVRTPIDGVGEGPTLSCALERLPVH